jgi:hypothetical protein
LPLEDIVYKWQYSLYTYTKENSIWRTVGEGMTNSGLSQSVFVFEDSSREDYADPGGNKTTARCLT